MHGYWPTSTLPPQISIPEAPPSPPPSGLRNLRAWPTPRAASTRASRRRPPSMAPRPPGRWTCPSAGAWGCARARVRARVCGVRYARCAHTAQATLALLRTSPLNPPPLLSARQGGHSRQIHRHAGHRRASVDDVQNEHRALARAPRAGRPVRALPGRRGPAPASQQFSAKRCKRRGVPAARCCGLGHGCARIAARNAVRRVLHSDRLSHTRV